MAFRQYKSNAGKRHNIDLSCTEGMEVEDYVRILVIYIYIFLQETPNKCDPESLIHVHWMIMMVDMGNQYF